MQGCDLVERGAIEEVCSYNLFLCGVERISEGIELIQDVVEVR